MKAERLVEMYCGNDDLLAFARWLIKQGYVHRTLLVMDSPAGTVDAPPGERCGKFLTKIGFEWDRAVNAATHPNLVPTPPCIVCGARAAKSLGLPYAPFEQVRPGVWVIPHPSGRCRTWNDTTARARGRILAEEIKQWQPLR